MNEKERNELLREILRRGDPAAGEPGLSVDEAQAMRRTVLSAVPPPRERFLLAPAFVTAAVVALSFVVVLSLWRAQEHHPPAPTPSVPVEEPPSAPPAAAPEILQPSLAPAPSQPVRHRRPARRDFVARPSAPDRPVEETRPEAPVDTPTRQVQFSTPGGTRIIWMLPETTR